MKLYIPAAIPSIVDNICISHYHWLQHYEDCIEKLYNIYVYIDLRSGEEENDCSSSKPYRNHTNTKFMIREKKRQIGYSGGRSFCLVSYWPGGSFVAGCCLLHRMPRLSRPTYAPTTPLNPFFFSSFSFPFLLATRGATNLHRLHAIVYSRSRGYTDGPNNALILSFTGWSLASVLFSHSNQLVRLCLESVPLKICNRFTVQILHYSEARSGRLLGSFYRSRIWLLR